MLSRLDFGKHNRKYSCVFGPFAFSRGRDSSDRKNLGGLLMDGIQNSPNGRVCLILWGTDG
jgi:hypothetical protein